MNSADDNFDSVSSVGDEWKAHIINKTQRFLDTPDERTFYLHLKERNLFGWIGVAYIAFFVWSYMAWLIRKVTGRA